MKAPRYSRFDCNPGCSVEATIGLLDGKWNCVILSLLMKNGTMRFNDLRRHTPDVTQRMLTNQLRELEADGFIVRAVYAQVPPKVEYCVSPLGRTLEPILDALRAWGDAHIDLFGIKTDAAPKREDVRVAASA